MKKDDDYQKKIMTFFNENQNVDGILAADSASGVIAINTALHIGLRVPEDISVIGFSSKSASELSIPKLTIIRQHAKQIGASVADLLIKRLEK